MADISKARKAVLWRVLDGAGKAPPAERRAAFANNDVPERVRTLVNKVAEHAYKVVDEDVAAARAAGVSEDELFELVVCAAIGQASRQYESALAALHAATPPAAMPPAAKE
jgi:hypothetical protein